MPGFFESLGRMAKGEPVFQPGDDSTTAQASGSQDTTSADHSNRTDGKDAPTVVISRVESDLDDSFMTISAEVVNRSSQNVYIDKAIIMGVRRELDRDMTAGEEHEFLVYQGPRPNTTHQTQAELHYRNANGDYFASIHYVEFRQLQDGLLSVEEMRFIPPVKDI